MRDDVYWSDGEQVTAADFKWAWLRNLAPQTGSSYSNLLDFVSGARNFRTGTENDPNTVGVRDAGPFALEVQLDTPVPYFIYITAMPQTFALPRHIIEEYGSRWWESSQIVSNGAFAIRRLEDMAQKFVRNRDYFARFEGNIGGFEWRFVGDDESLVKAYSAGNADIVYRIPEDKVGSRIPSDEIYRPAKFFNTEYLVFNPNLPPLDDDRVRRALAYATDWDPKSGGEEQPPIRSARGGIIPKGMPGHSPGIGATPDLARAKDFLAAAGYPEAKGSQS